LAEQLNQQLETPEDIRPDQLDAIVEEGLAAGGLVRKQGEEGPTDPNFPGGRLEGANDEWQGILDRMREAKGDFVAANRDEVDRAFGLKGTASPEAASAPIEHYNSQAKALVEAGYVKVETGATAEPDGLFFSNRLIPTSEGTREELAQFRNEAISNIKHRTEEDLGTRLSTTPDRGRELGLAIRELVARGMLDVAEKRPQRKQGQKGPLGPATYELTIPDDRRVTTLAGIHKEVFQEVRDSLEQEEEESLQTYLQGLSKELPRLRTDGSRHRDALEKGANADMAHEAREKLRQLDAIDQQHSLLEDPSKEGNYTANIEATQLREAAERAQQDKDAQVAGLDDVNAAHEEALQYDRQAKAASEAYVQKNAETAGAMALYENLIKAETDIPTRQALEKARDEAKAKLEQDRDAAAKSEHDRVGGELSAEVQRRAEAINAEVQAQADTVSNMHEMKLKAAQGQEDMKTLTDKNLALLVRDSLKLQPFPSLETKVGGFRKGTKVLESWFVSADDPRLWVLERYNRRTGELISQTMLSTAENPKQDRGRLLPPDSALGRVGDLRQQDQARLAERPGAKPDGSMGIREKVNFGRGAGVSIDQYGGVYDEYNQRVNPTRSAFNRGMDLKEHRKQGSAERGGNSFMYWLRARRGGKS
jgi:hypothetical protein